tara:strand:+ start:211 stop:663 length:453 start_codon:yes stop_codon:yes gene_type:complete
MKRLDQTMSVKTTVDITLPTTMTSDTPDKQTEYVKPRVKRTVFIITTTHERFVPKGQRKQILISVDRLVNPNKHVQYLDESHAILKSKEIVKKTNPEFVKSMLAKGKQAICFGRDVVVICKTGGYRAKAISRMIGESFPHLNIEYVDIYL